MAYQNRGTNLPGIVAAADYSAAQHRFVTINAAGKAALSTAGQRIDAAMENDPGADQAASLMGPGSVAKITAGEAISLGDPVASDATGRAVVAGASENIGGVALTAAGGAGELISVWMATNGGTATIGAGAVLRAMLEADIIDGTKIEDGAVANEHLAAGSDIIIGEDLGAPDLLTDNRFLLSVVMQATAYALDETTLPADNPPRNIVITHTTDTTTDTRGSAVVDGTNVDDEVIQETIVISADGVSTGAKAFKTVTAVTTAGWVQAGGVSDLLEVGFGNLLGLSRARAAASEVFLASLAGVTRLPDAIAVHAADVESNTISLTGGTYDSAKQARALIKL